jgi:hypothetical protein
LVAALLAVPACADAPGHEPADGNGGAAGAAEQSAGGEGAMAGAPSTPATVELGVPDGSDGLGFQPLVDGAVLKLQTFGQGGTHVMIGVRCTGFGNRAFVSATLHNDVTGVEVTEPPPARPQLLYCEDTGLCDLVPYLVHASGIAPTDAEKDGLSVRLTVQVTNESGIAAEGSREVVLSTADL